MLQYINKNNVVLFNGEKINKIPDDIVLYKKDVILPSISSIDFKELLFTFNEIVKALSFENDNIRGISETGIIRDFKDSISTILELYISLGLLIQII